MPPIAAAMIFLAVACIAAVQVFTVWHLWRIKRHYSETLRAGVKACHAAEEALQGVRMSVQQELGGVKEMADKVSHLIRSHGGIVEVKELPPRDGWAR